MPPEEDRTLELRDYLRVLRRRKWIIIVTVIICVAGAFAMSVRQSPTYSASTKVLLQQSLVDSLFVPNPSSSDASTQRNNEIQIMGSPEVIKQVTAALGRTPDATSISTLEGTDVVQISVESRNAKHAAETANATAQTYIKVRTDLAVKELQDAADELQKQMADLDDKINGINFNALIVPFQPHGPGGQITDQHERDRNALQSQRDAYDAQYQKLTNGIAVAQQSGATVLAPAGVPSAPKNQTPLSNLLAGLAIGLVLGIALAFLREYLDDRVKTKDDLDLASGETVIGLIPELSDWKNREATQLVSIAQPRSPAAEAYRTVRTSVEFLSLDQPIGSLQVTSSMAGEGKTTTLANLAVTFARVGQRVIVLCCDLRRPRIHEFFGLSNRVGFTSMLLGDAPASEAIQAVRGDLPIGLVASGPLAPNPAELLASKRAVSVIEELDSQCDLLLIDSPPVLPVTDAQVISGLVDGVLLVGSAGQSTKRDIRRAVELLHQVDAPLIGAILNNVHSKHDSVYTYSDNRYYIDNTVATNGTPERRNGGKRGKRGVAADQSKL